MKDEFFTKTRCDKCGGSLEHGRIMSRFNTDVLCMKCSEAEKKDPEYQKAVDAELKAIHNGDYNFKGIRINEKRRIG